MHCQLVNEQLRVKYDKQFYGHFANRVSELIYHNIYTENRVKTKDFLCYISNSEYLSRYVAASQQQFSQVIFRNAEYFESPLRITTEMPLMILTNTRDILQRRKKRLRKLFLAESESSSIDNTSYSSKNNPQSSSLLILSDLSKVSFTYPSSSESASSYAQSLANIYDIPQTINQLKELQYFQHFNFQKQHLFLTLQVQRTVKHLIVDFHPHLQFKETHSKRQYFQIETDSAKTKEPDQDKPQVSNQIQSVVKAELKRYNIYQIMERSSSASFSQLKVRDKAEKLLKNLQIDNIF